MYSTHFILRLARFLAVFFRAIHRSSSFVIHSRSLFPNENQYQVQPSSSIVKYILRNVNQNSFRQRFKYHSSRDSIQDVLRRREPEKGTTFDRMKNMESRLDHLERLAPETISGFYEKHLKSFSVRPGTAKRFSVTSTLYAIQALMNASDKSLYSSVINLDLELPISEESNDQLGVIQLREVVQATLLADWREDDLFQVPLLVHTILEVDKNRAILNPKTMTEVVAERMRRLISVVLSARPLRRNGQFQSLSDYIIFLCAQAMTTMYKTTPKLNVACFDADDPSIEDKYISGSSGENYISVGGLPAKALPDGAASQLSIGLSRCSEVSLNELCRQLAFKSAGDSTNFDVVRLAYSLLTYVTTASALSGTAGIEFVPGEGPTPGTALGPPNEKLVKEALRIFFFEQKHDGMWDQGQPIYKSFRRAGRDVGNAFVFAVDTLGSLLGALPAEYFREHLEALEKTLCWIETHQTVDMISNYCDSESLRCYGKALRGWSSPHLTQGIGVQGWSTAQTLTCISRMRQIVRELMHDDVLTEFGGRRNKIGPVLIPWDRLLNSDIGNPSLGSVRTLKDVLEERIIHPFLVENGPSYGAVYSAILFGPPGTAKTTICEALSERIGFDFLVVDTATFLADGLTNVAARIRYVFDRLLFLRNCVILFDEIEEFCLDRETPGLGMESRMLTTAMLTAINDLRRKKQSIFFLATNRLRAFDSAITRPGRFDLSLFVGAPNLEAKVMQFRQKLVTVPVSMNEKADAEIRYRHFLQSVWDETAMYMNYLEGLQFAAACANIVSDGAGLTTEAMSVIMKTQSAVMTIRSSLRDEYRISMDLSRL